MNHMEKEANTMKEQMESLQREKEQALKDKESLLDEVKKYCKSSDIFYMALKMTVFSRYFYSVIKYFSLVLLHVK